MQIAQRVQIIKESPTLAIAAKAQRMKAEGLDIIDLSTGEPDFDTPEHIKQAAIEALKCGFTKYTAVTGTKALKEAIINKFYQENGTRFSQDEIIVSAGAKHIFYNLCMAYLNQKDEVIIPAPFWVSYPDMVTLAGAMPILLTCPAHQGYKLTPSQLSAAVTPKTRLLVINSPANPTGTIYSLEELKALAQVLIQHPDILIASDDIYEHILMEDNRTYNILDAEPALKQQTLLINGVSKTFAMTGWRIGYAGGPSAIIQAMGMIQSQSTSNPCSIAQIAAQAALTGDKTCLKTMLATFRQRHDLLIRRFNQVDGLQYLPAKGAFYAFIDASCAITRLAKQGKITACDDLALTAYLLDQYHIAVVPGSAFGMADHFRISFATGTDQLEKALDRMAIAFSV